MRGWLLLALCGCNQIFGLTPTRPIDAAFFDAAPDAAPMCPAPGTPPRFSSLLHQEIVEYCEFFSETEAGDLAAADCNRGVGISDRGADGLLTPATLVTTVPITSTPALPRLTPEGDEMWVRVGSSFFVYSHTGDHLWTYQRDLLVPAGTSNDVITPPSRRVQGKRHFVRFAFNMGTLEELVDDGAQLTQIKTYTPGDFGVPFFQFPTLTADGLRLVFASGDPNDVLTNITVYSDRASIDDNFSLPARVLDSAPVVFDPFLTVDCGRIYTSGLGSIFYAQQQ
jgi:hypothetical protein